MNEEVLKLCNKKNLSEESNNLLLDRYLCLNLLNKIKIPTYDNYRKLLQNDINFINNKTKKEDLKSFDLITLKQAYNLYTIYKKMKNFLIKFLLIITMIGKIFHLML